VPVADRFDPHTAETGQEGSPEDSRRDRGLGDRGVHVEVPPSTFGAIESTGCVLDIDPASGGQNQLVGTRGLEQSQPPVEPDAVEQLADLADEGVDRGVPGVGKRLAVPHEIGQLLAGHRALGEGEGREREAPLAAREIAFVEGAGLGHDAHPARQEHPHQESTNMHPIRSS
jgi:hypothetical protein